MTNEPNEAGNHEEEKNLNNDMLEGQTENDPKSETNSDIASENIEDTRDSKSSQQDSEEKTMEVNDTVDSPTDSTLHQDEEDNVEVDDNEINEETDPQGENSYLEELTSDDYTSYNSTQVLKLMVELNQLKDIKKADKIARNLKNAYDSNYEAHKQDALDKFINEGNEESDFEYHGDQYHDEIESNFREIREKKSKHFQNLEKEKDTNLKTKNDLLEKLRNLVDGEEDMVSIESLKAIQSEWRSTGPVPNAQNKTLWANYNALLDRFYDNRSIYFELKELDRKKNMEAKIELCIKMEGLDKESNLNNATKILNELHDEYKHIGPVPKEHQEELWQRFKAASDKIYQKRKEFVDALKLTLTENLEKKQNLISKIEVFGNFNSDKIADWKNKTSELLEIQKEWKSIGAAPRDQAKKINKQFWNNFKEFFARKNNFFKSLDAKREENLRLKEELIARAEAIKESEDWNETAAEFKSLQQKWREIGPVPNKINNEVYSKFKAQCDHFFSRRRDSGKSTDQEYEANLAAKQEICKKLEAISKLTKIDQNEVFALQDEYKKIGFVPRNSMKKLQSTYENVLSAIVKAAKTKSKDEASTANFQAQVNINKLQGITDNSRGSNKKEMALKRTISQLENDLNTWKTNVQFLASSPKADKLKAQFDVRIQEAEAEINVLREQLKIINEE